MASKYGIAFSKSKVLHALVFIAGVHDAFWSYVQKRFGGRKLGGAYTKDNSK